MESAAPTILWRLFKSAGSLGKGAEHARAVILPGGPPCTLAFFANEALDRVENYETMDLALFRADEVRRSLEDEGWADD